MSVKTKAVISLVINVLMAGITTAIIISYMFMDSSGSGIIQSKEEVFQFFTTDSNILAAIAAVVVAVFDVKIIMGKSDSLPKAAVMFKFIGTACLALTMLTCLLFLAPKYGFWFIFGGTFFHVHLGAPLMAIISLCFFEKTQRISLPVSLTSLIPMVVYGVVYYVMAVVIGKENGGWRDLYHFTDGGNILIPIIFISIFAVAGIIMIWLLYNIKISKEKK